MFDFKRCECGRDRGRDRGFWLILIDFHDGFWLILEAATEVATVVATTDFDRFSLILMNFDWLLLILKTTTVVAAFVATDDFDWFWMISIDFD